MKEKRFQCGFNSHIFVIECTRRMKPGFGFSVTFITGSIIKL
jgi:hypothetical protein